MISPAGENNQYEETSGSYFKEEQYFTEFDPSHQSKDTSRFLEKTRVLISSDIVERESVAN